MLKKAHDSDILYGVLVAAWAKAVITTYLKERGEGIESTDPPSAAARSQE